MKKAYLAILERRNLRGAAAVHFTTERERIEAGWHGIDFASRAYVIPPPSFGAAGIANLKKENHSDRVLFLGRINPVKNLECLLDAWPLVRRRIPTALLEIAGDGDPAYQEALQRRVAGAGVADSVAFKGFVSGSQKAELLAVATVVVLPSHHENFGIAALEAIEAGVPVIVSPGVHLGDFVNEHGLGRVAQPGPQALSDAIIDVLGDERIQQKTRERGAAVIATHFSSAAIGELLSRMYLDAIDQTRYVSRR